MYNIQLLSMTADLYEHLFDLSLNLEFEGATLGSLKLFSAFELFYWRND